MFVNQIKSRAFKIFYRYLFIVVMSSNLKWNFIDFKSCWIHETVVMIMYPRSLCVSNFNFNAENIHRKSPTIFGSGSWRIRS